jgi:hypothetical protein
MFSVLYGLAPGRMKIERIIFRATFSAGRPSFSYIAKKKKGSMSAIIKIMAALLPIAERVKRYVGIPITAAAPKHSNCRFVRLNAIFVFIRDKSFGIFT